MHVNVLAGGRPEQPCRAQTGHEECALARASLDG